MPVVGESLLVPFTVGSEGESTELEGYTKLEKEILGTVANVRYYHQAAAWDSPLSFGVQAFIEYNGLVLNDRYQSDLIRVTGISGLDDAEVRDNRVPRPGESGEYAYDAFYGGRNLVLNGFVEAGSLPALGTLSQNLKAAFATLQESTLKFRWFDIYDPFDDPNTIKEYVPGAKLENVSYVTQSSSGGNYIPLIGSLSNLMVSNGFLSWNNASKVYVVRTAEKRTFCDSQISIKCIVGEKDSSYIGLLPCIKNEENYVMSKYEENSGSPKLNIVTVNSGVERSLISEEMTASLRPVIGQAFWIRSKKEGKILTLEYWLEKPSNLSFPSFSVSANLSGEDEENYGDEILSEVGFGGEQKNTYWSFDEFRIESLYPGDAQFGARKMNFSMKEEQTSLTKFKRPFQITMKTSDYRAFSSAQITNSIYPSDITSSVALGRTYPRTYPLKYRIYTTTSLPLESNLLSVNNRGTVFVEPILYLYGPGENILIENLTNSDDLEWLGTIKENDYIKFNCREKTIVNSQGINYLEPLVPNLEWIRIEPKWNDIYVSGSGFVEGKTKFVVKFRHGTM